MSVTYFNDDQGGISSIRAGNWHSGYSSTDYFGSDKGGLTLHTGNFVSRLNNNGTCIGAGLTAGRHTTYIGRNGNVSSRLTSF